MDYINIISKEAIEAPPDWCIAVGFVACIIIVSSGLVWAIKDKFVSLLPVMISGFIAIVVEFALVICFMQFCSVPTGRYRYEATIDKDNISVTEYEEFLKTYKPEIKENIYCWESEEIE
jgi:hypothetical protein